MVITPDLKTLKFKIHKGVKYFELVAEPVTQEILPGVFIKGWGYNGSIPGPTIKCILMTMLILEYIIDCRKQLVFIGMGLTFQM